MRYPGSLILAAVLAACGGSSEPGDRLVSTPDSLIIPAGHTGGMAGLSVAIQNLQSPVAVTISTAAPFTVSPVSGNTPLTVQVQVPTGGRSGGRLTGQLSIQAAALGGVTWPLILDVPAVTGTWSGSSGGFTLTLGMTETAGVIAGAGTIAGAGSTNVAATGSHAHPQVTFTISSAFFTPATFTGAFNAAGGVTGVLNGSGFTDFAITLTRQAPAAAVAAVHHRDRSP